MISNIVVDPEGSRNPRSIELFEGQAMTINVDANMWAVRESTTLSSAVWSVENSGVSIGSDTEASNASSALVTVSDIGKAKVKVLLTLADGQIYPQWIFIVVKEMNRAETRYWR